MKNWLILALFVLMAVFAFLYFTGKPDVIHDTSVSDSLRKELVIARAATDSVITNAKRDSAAFAIRDKANQSKTTKAIEAKNKAVVTLREYMAANPLPERDSLTEAALEAGEQALKYLTTENNDLRDRVAESQNAFNELRGKSSTAERVATALQNQLTVEHQELKTDYDKTKKANRVLKTVAIVGPIAGLLIGAILL